MKDALDDFFTKKKSRLSSATAKALLRAVPSPAAWLTALLQHASTPRNDFLKCEALQLLAATLHPPKVMKKESMVCVLVMHASPLFVSHLA